MHNDCEKGYGWEGSTLYLLDKAEKIDQQAAHIRSYLIENGQVRYVTPSFNKWKRKRVIMSGTIMMDGRVMLANSLLNEENFHKEQKRFIKKGCTTAAIAPNVSYERHVKRMIHHTKKNMAHSTLDYIIGATIPIHLLRPSFIQRCQRLYMPFLRVHIPSDETIMSLPWTHLSQTLTPYPLVLIPVFQEDETVALWEEYCAAYNIYTSKPLADGDVWDKSLLQKVGLYPQKGVLHCGSDADYLLFPKKDETVERYPTVVILKGEIIKANDDILLKPGFGSWIKVGRPGRFLSIVEQK